MNGPSTEGVLFDIDGTLITTGGAGAEAWRRAFVEIYDTEVDIRKVTESGARRRSPLSTSTPSPGTMRATGTPAAIAAPASIAACAIANETRPMPPTT
jgi:beta-phosphoglucomutase-like phosphatase (HAD superfamily)